MVQIKILKYIFSLQFVLLSPLALAGDAPKRPPRSLVDAVKLFNEGLGAKELRILSTIRSASLPDFHYAVGAGLRGLAGIWGNEELIKDAGATNAEEASLIILRHCRLKLAHSLSGEERLRIATFELMLTSVVPYINEDAAFEEVADEWNRRLAKIGKDLLGVSPPFRVKVVGRNVGFTIQKKLLWQGSIEEFLDQEGRKLGLIYYSGEFLMIDSQEGL